ncbi:MAG: type II toxin-antitoxin system VapC family toxin [Candidatus Woesearchaeota archaeon]
MYCLDTNILIDILRGDESLRSSIFNSDLIVSTTQINVCELYKGAYLSNKPKKNIELIKNLINNIKILDINEETYFIYGKIFKELSEKGKIISELDLLIASICLSHKFILITRNIKDFENISGLIVKKW